MRFFSFFQKMIRPFYFSQDIPSQKNKSISLHTFFGWESISVDQTIQSGTYLYGLFRSVIKMFPKQTRAKQILVLGLGAGTCLRVIHKRFPDAHIVAVEYDEVMIQLTRGFFLKRHSYDWLEIKQGDVIDVLPLLNQSFDLIFVDLFCGSSVSPAVSRPEFLRQIHRLLSWDGYLIVNFYLEEASLSGKIEQVFSSHMKKRYGTNKIGFFRHYGKGRVGEVLPNGFFDKEQSRQYLASHTSRAKRTRLREGQNILGLQSLVGSISWERYVGDQAPDLSSGPQIRIIQWQPLTKHHVRGWIPVPRFLSSVYKKGIAIIDEELYWNKWSSQAKRQRSQFLRNSHFICESVDLETFKRAYHDSKALDWFTRTAFLRVITFHVLARPTNVNLWVIKNKNQEARIVAGLVTVDFHDISQSVHMCSFIHKEAKSESLGVPLIDQWYKHCLEHGIRFANFGILRQDSDPHAWQGYTNFKRQFHLQEICYPPLLFRIIFPSKR
ncbi:TPA: hypothetical protein DCW61_01290 [Candidatus Uhrbacteria bacterium]|nr:hypothetical protein [Candidatus Uhrbacteria bacterium]